MSRLDEGGHTMDWMEAQLFSVNTPCAADHGTTDPCCGQPGTVDPFHQCPIEAPRCVGYEYGYKWGHCVDKVPVAAKPPAKSKIGSLHWPL